MIIKGSSDIRGVRSLNTKPGPMTESSGLLKLYQLAAEKDNLMKKLEWVKRQKDQAEKRLSEVMRAMRAVRKTVEEKSKREPTLASNPGLRSAFIKY